MHKFESLIQELAQQNADESIGDGEDGGVQATLLRGDLLAMADEYGYELGEHLQEKLHGLTGAIIFSSNNDITVETFDDDDALDEQWDAVAARVENELETQAQE